jgi:hypothetical protein
MTLEQVFFVTQSIAAAAVVASILYLAREVRQSERVQRATMQQGRADRASTAALTVATAELARIWQKGLSPKPDFTREEFTQWALLCRALRIPRMPAGDSSRCRASVPGHAGPGVSRTLLLSSSS